MHAFLPLYGVSRPRLIDKARDRNGECLFPERSINGSGRTYGLQVPMREGLKGANCNAAGTYLYTFNVI